MAKANRSNQYDESDTILQIQRDLEGAIRLGNMQAVLLKSVASHLSALIQSSNPGEGGITANPRPSRQKQRG